MQTLKQTSSLCPACLKDVPAAVVQRGEQVFLQKTCAEHGCFEARIATDRRWYFDARGAAGGDCCGSACGCGPVQLSTPQAGHDPTLVEQMSTCIALIEIVTSCNLKCPTCFADSPWKPGDAVDALSLAEFHRRLDAVLTRKSEIDILQISGGEPTIHPEFFTLFEDVLTHDQIGYTLLNTNGLRLARDEAFVSQLGELRRKHGKFEVYLQYDGEQAAGQNELRGGDLRAMRRDAMDACAAHDIPVTLAMVVNAATLPMLGEAVCFGLERPAVRGIVFQPEFGSGRTDNQAVAVTVQGQPAHAQTNHTHLGVADVVDALTRQTDGLLTDADFTPLPCGDPNCHTLGYLLRKHDEAGALTQVERVSDYFDFKELQGFLSERVNYDITDLQKCGCEEEPLGQILKSLEIGPRDVFRLFIKPFMDAWTYDQDRIDRCCVHVIGEGGSLESFCRHYAMRGRA